MEYDSETFVSRINELFDGYDFKIKPSDTQKYNKYDPIRQFMMVLMKKNINIMTEENIEDYLMSEYPGSEVFVESVEEGLFSIDICSNNLNISIMYEDS